MNGFYGNLVFIIIFLTNTNIICQKSWQRYNAPDESFTVNCPGGMLKYKEKHTITEVGKLLNKAYYINMDKNHPNFLYMVTSVQYPEGTFINDTTNIAESYLKNTAYSLQESTGCKSQYERIDIESEIPNMVMRLYDAKTETAIKAKIYLYKDVLYILQVYTNHDNKLNDFIDKFLNSFKLND